MKTKRISAWLLTLALLVTAFGGLLMNAPAASVSAKQLMGDMNGDSTLSSSDAYNLLLSVVRDKSMTSAQQTLGDLNGDGKFSTTDVRMVMLHAVNPPQSEPVRAFWLTYYEVETLYSSGNPSTVRSKIDALFDELVSKGTNTVYFHVRANSDAYYDSGVFNSYSATATLVSKGMDPFAYAVTSAHARGLKIEAWFNPYRIGTDKDGTRKKCDDWFSRTNSSGTKSYYYIPSSETVKNLVVSGVKEVVDNYDIDGVQFDDYFYPTDQMSTSVESFEQDDYNAYKNAGGTLDIAGWRRMHVSDLVARVYQVAHSREGCVFGISPAGDHEKTYSSMYGDVYSWLKYPGYIDYIAPQLYFGFNNASSPFIGLQNEWEELPRHAALTMVAGLAFYKTGLNSDTWAGTNGKYEWANNNNIISRQINQTKSIGWDGVAFFSYSSMTDFTDRNSTVAKADMDSACQAWLTFQ